MDIKKMNRYIKLTKVPQNARYSMVYGEVQALCYMALTGRVFEAIGMAFEYGQAKGYRMARRTVRE